MAMAAVGIYFGRHAIRTQTVTQIARIDSSGFADAGARCRGQYIYLLARKRTPIAASASSKCGATYCTPPRRGRGRISLLIQRSIFSRLGGPARGIHRRLCVLWTDHASTREFWKRAYAGHAGQRRILLWIANTTFYGTVPHSPGRPHW